MSPRDGPDMLYDGRRLREGALFDRLKQWQECAVPLLFVTLVAVAGCRVHSWWPCVVSGGFCEWFL